MKFYVMNRIPVKRRARFNVKTGRTYVDSRTQEDLQLVAQSYKGPFYTCPVAVIAFVYRQLPKAKKASEPFDCKPDVDNILKALMDGLNGVAYMDDKQVTVTYVKKLDREKLPGEYVKYAVIPVEKLTGQVFDMEGKICDSMS